MRLLRTVVKQVAIAAVVIVSQRIAVRLVNKVSGRLNRQKQQQQLAQIP